MNRSIWKWLVGGLTLLLALGITAWAGLGAYLHHRNATWLEEAEAAYAAGDWTLAKHRFERYLPQDRTNTNLLLKYADACRHIAANRVQSLQSACVAYLQILSQDPSNLDVRGQLLDLYLDMSAWGNIEYYARQWLASNPQDPDLRYYVALALDRMGQRDEAMENYRALAAMGTEHSDVYSNYARLLRDRGLEDKADEVYRDALASRPQDARVRVDYARHIARSRDWRRVDELLAEASRLSPGDPYVLIAEAQVASLRQDFDTAIDRLRAAVEEEYEPTTLMLLAGAYVAKDEFAKAIDLLKGVDPLVQADYPVMLITLADMQFSLGQIEDGYQTVARYEEAYPGQLPVQEYFAAKEMLVKGDAPGAVKKLQAVVGLRPGFHQAQYTLAVAYLNSGETALAQGALEAYLAKNPSDLRAQRLLAQHFGRPETLDATATRAAELLRDENGDPAALYSTGVALYRAAERSGALEAHADTAGQVLERALERNPHQVSTYYALVELALARGDAERAHLLVQDAESRGIAPEELRKAKAAIAADTGLPDEALKLARQDLSARAPTPADAIAWAGLLTARGLYKEAIVLLSEVEGRMESADGKLQLSLERASIATRQGDAGVATEWLRELDRRIESGNPLRRRYNTVKLQLIQSTLSSHEGNAAEAQAMIAQVRAEEPDNPVLQTIDGFLMLREVPPRIDEAEALFEQAAESNPNNVNAQWGLTRLAQLREDFPKALTHAERAASLAPDEPMLQLQLGQILFASGRRLEAERAFERALKLNPDDVQALESLAISLMDREQTRQAQVVMERLEALAARSPDAQAALDALEGRILMAEGDTRAAEDVLRAQYAANPDDAAVVRNLAVAIARQGRAAEAVALMREFAGKRASEPEVWVSLAQFYLAEAGTEDLPQASTALTRALIADPDYVPALRTMLDIRLRQGNFVEALGLTDRYLHKHPNSPDMLHIRAQLLFGSHADLQSAEEAVSRAISMDERPEYLATRGMILLARGDAQGALRDLQTAAIAMPATSARMDVAIADAYLRIGNLETSRQYLESATQKAAAGDAVAGEQITRVKAALKQRESAA
ncbi:MAG: tetratricopeptide repeat protein [Candidatus Hydrogenedentes bacterium]|nr:tetratricopeptide repeat protein [Candidatus Hydrogenedentota bacterium]